MLTTYTKSPDQAAKACVIWLHGLGANAENMAGVAEAFPLNSLPIRHVFVDAPIRPVTLNNYMPMRAWYDITGLNLSDREDRHGILQSEQHIEEIIKNEMAQGFARQQIYLAGFSQGGAMALFMAMRAQQALGGVISLSSYLPLQSECLKGNQLSLPIFMAAGSLDQVVLPSWTKLSYDFVLGRGYTKLNWKEYRMEHLICMDEITDVARWLEEQITMAVVSGETI